jgi:hypothetical protein
MGKIILWTLLISTVAVNALAWLVAYFSDLSIVPMFRIALIIGICFITIIFAGSAALLGFLETEDPKKQWNKPEE